ncbi:MAG: hypothetical protein HFF59_07095 [Lawsonibacter sp.]|jgi:hypothetical protein|uniref:hypothetical protein n=1 Tax=Lawsonibacter sp. JLR.KK007 TaxID=3114293 RepID=UPI002172C6E5|nr:hypothetical protein [Lawsonibacter sp.]MCI8990562.1 hypothetical protein [Lawsonibacter sp.]MCI9267492.1 hypothetical protein [Lawsonibacter sp.]
MELFQVIEDGEGIEGAILRALPARAGQERRVSERHPALLVVSPKAAEQGIPLPRQCRTVLLPGEMGGAPLQAASAVSYGVSPRDSLTISSREGELLWAALQRELVTVDGQVVERQEFPLALEPGEGELAALAAAGALLLLGVPPEKLGPPPG